jgi:hypothetical protein
MKMKNLVLSVVLGLASLSVVAAESNSTAVLRASSDFVYRGQDLTTSQGTVGLGVLFDNVVREGVFVSGDFDTVEVTPTNDNTRVRSDVQVGYGGVLGDVTYSVSLARVFNPVNYTANYTEVRGRAQYGMVYTEVGQGVSSDTNTDTYFSVGVEARPFMEDLLVGVSSSVINYNDDSFGVANIEWNNLQFYANYDVWRELDVNFGYSIGGNTPVAGLEDQAWIGASYTF